MITRQLHWIKRTTLFLLLMAIAGLTQVAFGQAFVHPGLLHTAADFARMQANYQNQPWVGSWNRLVSNPRSQTTWTPRPLGTVIRGGTGENYGQFFPDIAAAYQSALRYKITGDTAYADQSIRIMNAWSSTMTNLTGDADRFLASGIYGFEFCQAAEMMRGYSGWSSSDFTKFKNLMLNVFYPMEHDFLVNHNTACISNYWANWDLCNIAGMTAIGVLCDDRAKYNEALNYFKTGAGNGQIDHSIPFIYSGSPTLGQGQEEGRDQGHSGLDVAQWGEVCQQFYNQGDDMFAWENNKILAACEYFAKYNLGGTVPFTTYNWGNGQNCAPMSQTVISSNSRGDQRPVWDLIYNHYQVLKGIPAPNSAAYAASLRPDGGGGDYGANSGGFDQLGYTTLTCTLPTIADGTYRLINRNSGLALDAKHAETTNGTPIQQYAYNGGSNQQWTATSLGNGQYKIIGLQSGRSLDVKGQSTANGAAIQLYDYLGQDNQKWVIAPASGNYFTVQGVQSGKLMEVVGNGTTNGVLIDQWQSNGGNNQQWLFQSP